MLQSPINRQGCLGIYSEHGEVGAVEYKKKELRKREPKNISTR